MPAQKAPKAPEITLDDINDPIDDFVAPEPVVETPAVKPFDLQDLIDSGVLNELIASTVQHEIETNRGANKFVGAEQHSAPQVQPEHKHLGHYRCDASPEIQVIELDMEADNPRLSPLPGAPTMRFRRGHFYAQTENQVKQLEWMMSGVTGVPDVKQKFGGISGIYKDSGEVLYYCPHGCSADQFVSANKSSLDAHLRAVHGLTA